MAVAPIVSEGGSPASLQQQPAPLAAPPMQEFRARLLKALQNLMTLRVTTVVGPVKLRHVDDFDAKTEVDFPDDQVVESASTAINLVEGDITQVRTQRFAEDPAYAKLHDDSLTAARSIISDNLAALKAALTGLERLLWKA